MTRKEYIKKRSIVKHTYSLKRIYKTHWQKGIKVRVHGTTRTSNARIAKKNPFVCVATLKVLVFPNPISTCAVFCESGIY